MNNRFRVIIRKSPFTDALDFYFVDSHGPGQQRVARPVDLVFEPLAEGAMPKGPTMTVGGPWAEPFLHALAEALDDENVKTENDHKIAGTLEATKGHLADLQVLLGLRPKRSE